MKMFHLFSRKKKVRTQKQIIGDLGEKVARKFLMKHGFQIIEQNYWKKWGEIDIIAQKQGVLHFVEVKTVSREKKSNVPRETLFHMAAENVHAKKLQRLYKAIDSYLLEKNVSHETPWQLDVVMVILYMDTRRAAVDMLENVS
ncbi:MAG TPA: YraN family protein [Candidatus Paceibacterota bacterium]|nr:YraN family protein [Candidatus Paceibacterota bacterium]